MNTTNKNQDKRNGDQAHSAAENENIISSHSDQNSNDDVARVKELHGQLNRLGRKTLMLAREAGEILCRLKENTPHGKWESYVEQDLGLQPRSASNYMLVWKKLSSWETIGESLKSETVSDMGMREFLDYCAEQKKSSSTKSDGSPTSKSSAPQLPQPAPTLSLADDSKISFKKISWKEGLISKDCLESSLNELASKPETRAGKKSVARRQRFVAEIAASINRCSGKANPEAAMKIAQAALETVIKMISETNAP